MLKASAGKQLPTTIIGSLPRPSWYTENLGTRSFLDAMVDIEFRDQYTDALSIYLRQQELAGLDIVTDGDCRFDHDVGGQSWTRYPAQHLDGFERGNPRLARRRRRWPRLPARAHPARLPRGPGHAADRRPDRARRPAVRGALEGRPAAHDPAGEVRDGDAGADRVRRAGLATTTTSGSASWRSATR